MTSAFEGVASPAAFVPVGRRHGLKEGRRGSGFASCGGWHRQVSQQRTEIECRVPSVGDFGIEQFGTGRVQQDIAGLDIRMDQRAHWA